jgi:hypothetical protein
MVVVAFANAVARRVERGKAVGLSGRASASRTIDKSVRQLSVVGNDPELELLTDGGPSTTPSQEVLGTARQAATASYRAVMGVRSMPAAQVIQQATSMRAIPRRGELEPDRSLDHTSVVQRGVLLRLLRDDGVGDPLAMRSRSEAPERSLGSTLHVRSSGRSPA